MNILPPKDRTMRTLLAACMLAMPLTAFAQTSGIEIDHVWSRATMAGHAGVVYLTITDTGPPDTLIGIATPVATTAGLHETINDNGVMKMRPVASLPIARGKAVTLAPGGYHIMLTDLKQSLKEGDSFPVTLCFAKAGQITAAATVEKAGAAAMSGMDHGNKGSMGNMPMPAATKQP
jgi:copper(I)-binding protein